MRIKPFRAWLAAPGMEARIAAPPYDVVDRISATAISAHNPHSFLHVSRADVDMPEITDPCDARVYAASARAFADFQQQGWLQQDDPPALYAYRLASSDHEQIGLVTVVHTADYEDGIIRRHEFTRPGPEQDRTRHIQALQAQAGPILLAFRSPPRVEVLLAEVAARTPFFDFAAPDGIRHTGWRIPDTDAWVNAFSDLPAAYIADGHHRAAGAARVARERRAGSTHPENESEADWMLAALFPASHLRILGYHRCVRNLGELTPHDLLTRLETDFYITPEPGPSPSQRGRIALYMNGRWYGVAIRNAPPATDRVASLDVSVLHNHILSPFLGIDDPRRDERLYFLGGSHGVEALARQVDAGEAAAAFALHPVSMEDLMAISDTGRTLPPKSTWFEPKLRSGLFVHAI